MSTDKPMFRLSDPDGGYWLCLPYGNGGRQYVIDGDEIDRPSNGWVHRDEIPATIELLARGGFDVTGYRLIEGMVATARYPATLTVEEFRDQTDEDEQGYDPRVEALYEPIQVERPPKVEPFVLPTLELVGAPPGVMPKGLTWAASLPYELGNHPEYLHLFPGRLNGVRDRLKKVLEANGAVVYNHKPGQWDVSKVLAVAGTMRKRKEGRRTLMVPDTIRAMVPVPLPAVFIEAPNRAEALAQYEKIETDAVAMVQALVGVEACRTCKGDGVVPKAGAA